MLRPDFISEREVLAPMTTMGIGGEARYLARCQSVGQIRTSLEWATNKGLRVQPLGGGSNTLFDDGGFDGLVMKIELRGVSLRDEGDNHVAVSAASGEDWDALVVRCIAADLTGIECLSGIPGLVGATPMQNVGAYGQDVAQTIVAVRALDRHNLEVVEFTNPQCGFCYRSSRFKNEDRDRYIITEVRFNMVRKAEPQLRYLELQRRIAARGGLAELEPGAEASTAVRAAVIALRREKSMVVDASDPNSRSMGSFFLNPVLTAAQVAALAERCGDAQMPVFEAEGGHKVPAAWLVEQAGFHKGYTLGGAAISDHHALAIVHRGGGSRDVLRLADEIQQGVRTRLGVCLQREPVIVPRVA